MAIRGFDRDLISFPQQPMQQAAQPTKQKDFWTDQISTGTGIGGALAGAGLGASIGSVVPGIGTAIGGLIGGIAGGALGSGGGQLAENAITGEQDLMKGVGQEALLGGVFSAPPIRAAKAALGAGKALATGAGKEAAKTAAETALTKPGMINNFTKSLAGKSYAQAFNVPRRFAGKLNPEETSQKLIKYGISGSLDTIENKSNQALSSLGRLLDQSVTGIGGDVKVGDVTSVFKDLSKSNIPKGEIQALRNAVTEIGTTGRNLGYENPSRMLDSIRELEKKGYNLVKAGESNLAKNPNQTALGDAYIKAAQELEDSLYGAISSKGTLKALQTEVNQKALNSIAKGLGDEFMQVKDAKQLRSLMAPFVKARQLTSLTRDEAQAAMTQGLGNIGTRGVGGGAGALGGFALGGPVGATVGGLGGFLAAPLVRGVQEASQAPISTTAGRLISGVANATGKRAANPETVLGGMRNAGVTPLGIGARLTAANLATGAMEPQSSQAMQPQGLESMLTQSQATQPFYGGSIFGQPQPQQTQSPAAFSSQQLGQAYMAAMASGDLVAAEQLASMYQMAANMEQAQAQSPALSQSNQSALASADNATNTLNQLEQLYANAGGAKGRLGGFVQGLTANAGLDSNAKAYSDLAQASVTQIAKALAGSGAGTVSDADARVIIEALPTLYSTPEEARIKFDDLRRRLEAARNNTLFYGQGGTSGNDLTSVLTQGAL